MMKTVSGIVIPDTRLALEATALVREVSSEVLFNHCVRTYVFGAALGQKLKKDFDHELLYLACVLHDLGFVEQYMGAARFEIDSADAARTFLTDHGYAPEKAAIAWDAIALHTTMEIPLRREEEVALLHMGAFLDGGGMHVDQFQMAFYEEVFEALPRMKWRENFIEILADVFRRKPHTAYLGFEADIARRKVDGYNPVNFCDHTRPYPFNL